MTLTALQKMVHDAGYTVSVARSWETDEVVYACSVETSGPATYGHPQCEAAYSKGTGWFQMTGRNRTAFQVS